jgi:cell division protein FtsB
MDINAEIEIKDLKYENKELKQINEDLKIEIETLNEQLSIARVVESAFSFNDLEVCGSNHGDTGIIINMPEKGRESVFLKHKPTGTTGYVELNI